ncbi:hypothetical protein [Saccharothrix hoggarensis]|uniref:Peptidase inhibitor family I36 n=1 Tax=Saccharothrix hoggarensis TaxID=913853 RepID=A0ABW3QQ68_9PSEU
MHKLKAVLGALAVTGAAILANPGTSAAVDGALSATSPDGGAYGSVYADFTSPFYVNINSIYINDRCPGDGVRAVIRFHVRYNGDAHFTQVGSREDAGGCESDPYRGATHWGPTNRKINDFGITVCSTNCSGMTYRDNPHN